MAYTPVEFSYDDKAIGVSLILAQLTGEQRYAGYVANYLRQWMPGS